MTYDSDCWIWELFRLNFFNFASLSHSLAAVLELILEGVQFPVEKLSSLLLRSVNFGIEELHNFQPMIKSVHYTANISRRKPSFLQISAGPVL